MSERVIHSTDCLDEGLQWLVARDPRLAAAAALTGPLRLRLRPDGFEALASAIVSQQVSTASADAIWARLQAAGLTSRAALASADDDALRGAGLMPDDRIIAELPAVSGIGRWTAEIYAMLALGRADIFAPADLALQEAVRLIYDLPARPGEKALRIMAADWTPWRSVAAQLFCAYYRIVRQREGIR